MHTRKTLFRVFVPLLFVLSVPALAKAQVPDFEAFFVLGDSLADNGNIYVQSQILGMTPPVPPSTSPHLTYFDGRFSNGYVGFEFLWETLSGNAPGTNGSLQPFLVTPSIDVNSAVNFAFGGTGTPLFDQTPGGFWAPGLKGQVNMLRIALRGRKPSSRTLFAIATGANDYRIDQYNVPMDPADVADNIGQSIESLYRMGARHVMVLDLPDLALVPANGGDPNASLISQAHNAALAAVIASLQSKYPKLHLFTVQLDPLFLDLLGIPGFDGPFPTLAGFPMLETVVPGMSGCLFVDPSSCEDVPLNLFNDTNLGFLFWDAAHPTTQAHQYLGEYMYQQLVASYED